MKKLLFVLAIILSTAIFALGQAKYTETTLKLAEGQTGAKATIADMAWLAGTWTGSGLGGVSEEIWSKPQNGIMMGMYRMLKDGKPIFYELLTLEEKDGTLLIRLKHFSANFVGWEEKDKTVDFKFVKKEGKRMYFDGMTFESVGKKDLNVYLAIENRKDGSVKEEIFRYKRVE